jgi:toxin CptA
VHTAAVAIVAPVELSAWMKAALLAAIGVSLVLALRRHAWLSSTDAITAIELGDEDALICRYDGRSEHARLLGTTYISPYLTLLNLRVMGRILPRHMILVPDNVDPEAFRRLRVWLRWAYSEK